MVIPCDFNGRTFGRFSTGTCFIIIIARGVMNEQINELLLKMTYFQKRLDLD